MNDIAMNNNDHIKKERFRKTIAIVKLMVLAAILILIPLYIWFFHPDWILALQDYRGIVDYMRASPGKSVPFILGCQIVQIIVCFIPGQVFQIAAGAVFGFLPGLLLSITGALIGVTITYHLAGFLGRDAMNLFFGEEKMAEYIGYLNSERAYLLIFLIFLIPGLPKDLVSYAAGISNIHFRAFLLISTTARIPAMCASLAFGHFLIQGDRTGMIMLAVIVAVILIIGFLLRDKLKKFADDVYQKIS